MQSNTSFAIEIDGKLYSNASLRQIDFAIRLLEQKELAQERAAKRSGASIERQAYARSADFLSAPTKPRRPFQGRIAELTHCPEIEVHAIEWLLRDAHADPELLRTSQLIYEASCAYRILRWLVTRAARGDVAARELLARIDRESR
ncbi:MAG: hypothetical protein IPN34_16635 [Planctomycetes bacterium]|nr:hypothetical protein [Planctomycetota bacterium]